MRNYEIVRINATSEFATLIHTDGVKAELYFGQRNDRDQLLDPSNYETRPMGELTIVDQAELED